MFTSWVGTCPGKQESAEENSSSRSAKGNKYMRRMLNQAANAAARSKGTHFQAVFRRLLPRLGYQSAVWAIAHRLCRLVWKILHEGIRYIERGIFAVLLFWVVQSEERSFAGPVVDTYQEASRNRQNKWKRNV